MSRRELWTHDDDLVFVSPTGGFVDESVLRRRFYKALKAAKLPRMRFHDLRHTFGTLAVQAFSLTDVKAFMGHADIQTTMIYAHHVPQHDAADRLTRCSVRLHLIPLDAQLTHGLKMTRIRKRRKVRLCRKKMNAGGGTRTPDTRIMMLARWLRAFAGAPRFAC